MGMVVVTALNIVAVVIAPIIAVMVDHRWDLG